MGTVLPHRQVGPLGLSLYKCYPFQIQVGFFWVMTPGFVAVGCQRFGGLCCLQLQGDVDADTFLAAVFICLAIYTNTQCGIGSHSRAIHSITHFSRPQNIVCCGMALCY